MSLYKHIYTNIHIDLKPLLIFSVWGVYSNKNGCHPIGFQVYFQTVGKKHYSPIWWCIPKSKENNHYGTMAERPRRYRCWGIIEQQNSKSISHGLVCLVHQQKHIEKTPLHLLSPSIICSFGHWQQRIFGPTAIERHRWIPPTSSCAKRYWNTSGLRSVRNSWIHIGIKLPCFLKRHLIYG